MTQSITGIGGIDIAKEKLDAAVHGMPGGIVVENDAAGWKRLAEFLIKLAYVKSELRRPALR